MNNLSKTLGTKGADSNGMRLGELEKESALKKGAARLIGF